MRSRANSRRNGFALLITSVLLMLVALLSLVAIEHTGSEAASSARSRSSERTLQAADAGMQLALVRVSSSPPNLGPIDVMIGDVSVQSRRRNQGTPQNLTQLSSGPGGDLYLVNITAFGPDGSTSELEAKLTAGGDIAGGVGLGGY